MIEKGDIILKEVDISNIDSWYKWLNDPEITKYQDKGKFPNTKEKQYNYITKMQNSNNNVLFAITYKKTGFTIGSVSLQDIDWINRSAKLGIMIGKKSFIGKGIGKIVWNMITKHGLFELNLHRIYADCFEENKASLKCALASGFKVEGTIRDKYYKNGKWHNAIILSVLKDEFKEVKS